ncbi:cuticle protein 19, partial [Eurytemora carolleeae]|uniref:cuticle protein 19 n=1 Tax=Eurytemora carolleeae TaxID=1294199 RepID=UPI000C76CFCE
PYSYTYGVSDDYSKAAFNAAESSNGDGAVTGEYSVALPDGRTQHVKYTADHYNGYVADVTYEGVPVYPEVKAYAPKPAYAPAPYSA